MIPVAEAQARVAAAFRPTTEETIAIAQAANRVLAHDSAAKFDQPPFPVSAMDGYAVRTADTAKVPCKLRVIGSSPAGHPFAGSVRAGEAVRIFTGGVVPDGADAIVIQEDTSAFGENVEIRETAKAGKHIRRAGLDFAKGDVLAEAGRRLSSRDLSLLAAGDVAAVSVRRKPVIAIAATGDELSRPGEQRRPGGIVASSGYGLSAMIDRWGGEARDLGIFPDTIDAIASIADHAKDCDLIVTLGGASVGDHDLIQKALGPRGFALDFWKIAMRPGKPLIFGRLGSTPLLGLPGNPVSALVCAMLFVRPALAALLGLKESETFLHAKLASPLPRNDSRQDYIRARREIRDGEIWIAPFPVQDSSMMRALANADALIVRPPNDPERHTGDFVQLLPLD